jgi:hypothetical protein
VPNPASIADIEARWRPLTEQEAINADVLTDDAWEILLTRRPNLEDDMAALTVSEPNVIRVVCAMVLRVLRNPDGLLEESIDDYRYRRDSVLSAGLLYATDDELADITPGRRRRSSVRLVVYGDA